MFCTIAVSAAGALEANIGQCFRLILEGNPCHGALLKQQDKSLKLYWTVGMFLQDGSAQKHTFGNKHDSGGRMRLHCKNIFSCSGSALAKQKALYLPSSSPRLPWTWPLTKKSLMHGRG